MILIVVNEEIILMWKFFQMRSTKKVSVWPVGMVGGLRYESPICDRNLVNVLLQDVSYLQLFDRPLMST